MKFQYTLLFCLLILISSCKTKQLKNSYETDQLKLEQLTENSYRHISYLATQSYGKVPCNGMVVMDKGEAIVIDTPTDDAATLELINWIETKKKSKVKALVVSHFHVDCLGGINIFHAKGIPSYANTNTIELAKADGAGVPQNGFYPSLEISFGNKILINEFLGEGHTKDNIISYFPDEKVLFGGCLVKADGGGKGNLNDANVAEWSNTVKKVKSKYKAATIVIPGHGKAGGTNLLDFTIDLFAID